MEKRPHQRGKMGWGKIPIPAKKTGDRASSRANHVHTDLWPLPLSGSQKAVAGNWRRFSILHSQGIQKRLNNIGINAPARCNYSRRRRQSPDRSFQLTKTKSFAGLAAHFSRWRQKL